MISIRLYKKSKTEFRKWDTYLGMREEVKSWCSENIVKDDYRLTENGFIIFDKEEDALAFRMKFDL